MMAAGGGGGAITMREAAKRPPEQATVLKTLGPALAGFSAIGLGLMWLSGVALVFAKYDGLGALPALFWVKMLFVTLLTLLAFATHLTYRQVKAGNVAAAARLPVLGPMSGVSSLVAVTFAVFAFH